MARYKEIKGSDAVLDQEYVGDGFRCVSKASKEYQDWLAQGNTSDPADPVTGPTYQELRIERYRKESDPLGMEYRYLETTADPGAEAKRLEWIAKVIQIKTEIPKV